MGESLRQCGEDATNTPQCCDGQLDPRAATYRYGGSCLTSSNSEFSVSHKRPIPRDETEYRISVLKGELEKGRHHNAARSTLATSPHCGTELAILFLLYEDNLQWQTGFAAGRRPDLSLCIIDCTCGFDENLCSCVYSFGGFVGTRTKWYRRPPSAVRSLMLRKPCATQITELAGGWPGFDLLSVRAVFPSTLRNFPPETTFLTMPQ